jgi:hypothetical protein
MDAGGDFTTQLRGIALDDPFDDDIAPFRLLDLPNEVVGLVIYHVWMDDEG